MPNHIRQMRSDYNVEQVLSLGLLKNAGSSLRALSILPHWFKAGNRWDNAIRAELERMDMSSAW